MNHEHGIGQTAATILQLLEVDPGSEMAGPHGKVLNMAERTLTGEGSRRVFFYNPDAIGMWIYRKFQGKFVELEKRVQLRMKIHTAYPPVTPVCFGSMYTGLPPKEHGITKCRKPVLLVDTVFDCLVRAGKKAAIISTEGDSISRIFLGRDIDYFIYPTVEECNEKALNLIERDKYDFMVLYNGNYDYMMHRFGPEGSRALEALDKNIETFLNIYDRIKEYWKDHPTILAFAPDHGCHKKMMFMGSHGAKIPYDMETIHFYSFINSTDQHTGMQQ